MNYYENNKYCKGVLVLIALVFWPIAAYTQQASGSVSGKVTDTSTGEVLPWANTTIVGTNMGAATDKNGNYYIPNVPPGTYTLRASYLGYGESDQTIVLTYDETLNINFELTYGEVLEGEEIIVTAQASGELSAINQQLGSNTITNIVDESQIKELPDANAAESVGRLPGVAIVRSGGEATKVTIRGLSPKFNAVTVNGVTIPATGANDRSVDLSLISSNMLNGIEVIKAALPDKDANSFGGTIDLKLTEAKPEASFDVSLKGGYSQYRDIYGNYDYDISFSNRFFSNRLGVVASVHSEEYDRSADKFSGKYIQIEHPTKGRVTQVSGIGLVEENVTRRRNGGVLFLDYKLPYGKITANSFYNQKDNNGVYNTRSIKSESGNQYWETDVGKTSSSIFTNILSLNQDFDWIKYNATIALTSSKYIKPEYYRWRAIMQSGVMTAIPDETTHPDSLPGMVSLDSPIMLSHIWVDKHDREENRSSLNLDIEAPFRLGSSISGSIKTGIKISRLDRFNDQEQNGRAGLQHGSVPGQIININDYWGQIDSLNPNIDMAAVVNEIGYIPIDFVGKRFNREDFLEGNHNLEWVFDLEMMRPLTEAYIRTKAVFDDPTTEFNDSFYRNHSIGSRGFDYSGEEATQAGYVMGTFHLGKKLTFIPGIRWEGVKSNYEGQRFREIISAWQNLEPVDLEDLEVERENDFWLPMIHLQYKPLDWLKIRIARTETVSRPNYNYYTPISHINGFETSIQAANSQIRPSRATNYDLSVSVYENKVGLLTISPFHKRIEDNIIPVSFNLHPDIEEEIPDGLNIPISWYEQRPTVKTFINNPSNATYSGIEFSWNSNLWYLPSVFKGLVLGVNYTYIESSTKYTGYKVVESDSIKSLIPRPGFDIIEYYKTLVDTSRVGRMLDQPTDVGNITLGYDYKDFSVRFTYLYQSDISTYIHSVNSLFDTFSAEYSRMDMQIKQRINSKVEIYGNYRNITKTADRSYMSNSTLNPSYLEYYGSTIDIGIRYRM
jgi:TonB-dependent receptor